MNSDQKHLENIRRLAHLLDNAFPIPGTNYRVGIDPLLGLIPGIGDAITSLMSTYIVLIAMQMRVSKWTLTRMIFNILIESVIGIIPVVGDIFDAAWKSNEKNRRLLEEGIKNPAKRGIDRWFVILVVVLLLAIFVATVTGAVVLIQWILSQLT